MQASEMNTERATSMRLAESIIESGTAAFDPSSSSTSDEQNGARNSFAQLIESTGTWRLVQVLNALVKPGAIAEWLRAELMKILTLIPLRRDGVRATLEFVFSVHPSNMTLTKSEEAGAQKKGASITPEAMAMGTRVLCTVPASVTPQAWIEGIAPQLLVLLDSKEGEELSQVAAQVISFGILGKRQLGSPGSPGWVAFVEPILHRIRPSLNPIWRAELDQKILSEEVVDLTKDPVLIEAADLHLALRRLSRLLHSSPSPGLCRRLVSRILPELWTLSSWTNPSTTASAKYCDLARPLLKMYLKIAATKETADVMIKNLVYIGDSDGGSLLWKFRPTEDGNIEIVVPRMAEGPPQLALCWNEAELKAKTLVGILVEACTDEEISVIFRKLFESWLSSKMQAQEVGLDISLKVEEQELDSQANRLLEVLVLQQLMEQATGKLVSKADQLLGLVCQVLDANSRETQEEEVVSVTLSILNQIISGPTFQKKSVKPEVLELIESSLGKISEERSIDISQTARNLLLLLKYRDELGDEPDMTSPSDRQIEDRNTYKLALSYITEKDSPPPVKSEGLNLVSGLILSNSSALDIPAVLVLLSSLLTENEDFINLRVIKMYVQLANKHPKTVCEEILDHYLDAKERASTDTRLRFGEALVQVIERLGSTFTGDLASQVSETLLSIASRRGHRPKTMAKQAREERMRQKRNQEAEEAWGGEVLDMSEDVPEAEEESMKNEILSQIVQGWESRRGSEDVRMRASALSILSSAMETSISGVGPTLVSAAVDLCIHVLAFEPELEKGILRRAAIFVILGFVRALDDARQTGRRLGFGLTDESREDILRTLRYIEGTDQDGLVQQHARDVIESLENWQMRTLLPEGPHQAPAMGRLAALKLDPGSRIEAIGDVRTASGRPKIEEIE